MLQFDEHNIQATGEGRRTAVIVLGMHRSGTSALARVLNLLGCDLPRTLMEAGPGNEAGHWESRAVVELNDRILESAGSSWDDWLPLNPLWFTSTRAEEFRPVAKGVLNREFGSSHLFVLKDPRICRLLPFWLEILAGAGVKPLVILPIRNPLEVAASLEKRDGHEPTISHLLWLRHVLEAEAASRSIPRLFLTYDQLLADWGKLVEAQSTLKTVWPRLSARSSGEIDGFLSERHRHHRSLPASVVGNRGMAEWLRQTFSIVLDWTESEENAGQHLTLDSIRRQFDDAAPAFAPIAAASLIARSNVVRLKKQGEALNESLTDLRISEADLRQRLSAGDEGRAALQKELRDSSRSAVELQNRLLTAENALAQKQLEVEETAASLSTARAELDQLRTDADRLRSEKATLERKANDELRQLQGRLAERFNEITALTRLLQVSESKVDALLRSTSWRVMAPFRAVSLRLRPNRAPAWRATDR